MGSFTPFSPSGWAVFRSSLSGLHSQTAVSRLGQFPLTLHCSLSASVFWGFSHLILFDLPNYVFFFFFLNTLLDLPLFFSFGQRGCDLNLFGHKSNFPPQTPKDAGLLFNLCLITIQQLHTISLRGPRSLFPPSFALWRAFKSLPTTLTLTGKRISARSSSWKLEAGWRFFWKETFKGIVRECCLLSSQARYAEGYEPQKDEDCCFKRRQRDRMRPRAAWRLWAKRGQQFPPKATANMRRDKCPLLTLKEHGFICSSTFRGVFLFVCLFFVIICNTAGTSEPSGLC